MAFCNRLKESRVNAGLTQEQLAKKLGIATSTLSGYESGNREPTIATISTILDILNVDANYLYQDETKSLTELVVNLNDKELLEKYHSLDDHGHEVIDFLLDKEYERYQLAAKNGKVALSSDRDTFDDANDPDAAEAEELSKSFGISDKKRAPGV